MKRKTNRFLIIAALMTVLLSVTACQDSLDQRDVGTGKLALSINGEGGRTILPSAATFTKYELKFYKGQTLSKTVEWTSGSGTITLDAGTYRLEVTGFISSAATASGTINSIVVTAGSTVSKKVILDPYTEGTVKGTFGWNLSAFTDKTKIEIVIYKYGNINDAGKVTLSNADAAGTQQLDAGVYSVEFKVTNTDSSVIQWRNTLYVYPGLTSSCSYNPDSVFVPGGENEVTETFTISGRFADTNNDVNAKFYASIVEDTPSSNIRSVRSSFAAAAAEISEVELVGLLEDGDLTLNLKGTYNTTTKDYILSAAASFFRYSISGKLTLTDKPVVIVQVKAGASWISFVIEDVEVESSETNEAANEINGTVKEDALEGGIPQGMWGVWWGMDTLQKDKDNIFQPGSYFYVLDAYTIKQYIDRYGIWNLESYTCFFEGATVDAANNSIKGRVEFNYTDQAKIENSTDPVIKNWWINHLIAYAAAKWNSVDGGLAGDSAKIAEVLVGEGWKLWSDSSWTAVLNKYKAPAQADEGELGTNQVWNKHFGPGTGFSYTAYRNDAYRIDNNGRLQFGTYYAANGDYFNANPDLITGYNQLKWGALHSRGVDASSGPSSQIALGTLANGLTIPAEVTAIMHNNFQEKTDVLQVVSGAHWSVLDYKLGSLTGSAVKYLSFDVSMDVWLGTDARIAWQINQGAFGSTQKAYPVIAGSDVSTNPVGIYEAGKWHNIKGKISNVVVAPGKTLYLSTMQILTTSTDINAPTSLVENEIYLANVSITVTPGSDVVMDEPLSITGNLGNYSYSDIWEGDEVVGYDYNRALWGLSGDNLKMAKADDAVLELTFTEPLTSLTIVWGASVNGWWSSETIVAGGVGVNGATYDKAAGKLTIKLPQAFPEFDLFRTATYANLIIIDWNAFNINDLKMTGANLSGTIKAESNIEVRTVFDQDRNLELYATAYDGKLTVYLYDYNDYGYSIPEKTYKMYVNGQLKTGTGEQMQPAYKIEDIDVSTLSPGAHSGTIVVTIGSTVLSQKFSFMVTE